MKNVDDFLKMVPPANFDAWCQSICAELRGWDVRYDWVGIYWLDGDMLQLGQWSGRHATEHVRIPVQAGICGAAVREAQTIIVDDVQSDPRYLACFMDTRTEIVVPIYADRRIIGEIDIDGVKKGTFDEEDKMFLEALAEQIGKRWSSK
jgi:L-methionine (R)-S-oxide reductase